MRCIVKQEQTIFVSCIYPVIDNEFCHDIVKVVCQSTLLSPHGFTATLTCYAKIYDH